MFDTDGESSLVEGSWCSGSGRGALRRRPGRAYLAKGSNS